MRVYQRRHKGFILVATVWMLAVLVLAVSAFAVWVERGVSRAEQLHIASQGELDIAATRATLLYLLTTNKMNQAGLTMPDEASSIEINLDEFFIGRPVSDMGSEVSAVSGQEIRLDGTAYKGVGTARFAIQDGAGLISVNTPSVDQIRRLFEMLGYSERFGKRMYQRLKDYTDSDDNHRANGAERYHYRRHGLSGPANALLSSRYELVEILGWREVDELWRQADVLNALTANRTSLLNLNTLSPQGAKLAFGLTDEQVDILINTRREAPFMSSGDALQRTNLPLGPYYETISVYPDTKLRINLWYKGARLERELGIKLTFLASSGAPWLISRDFTQRITERYADIKPESPSISFFP